MSNYRCPCGHMDESLFRELDARISQWVEPVEVEGDEALDVPPQVHPLIKPEHGVFVEIASHSVSHSVIILVTYEGQTRTLKDWAVSVGLRPGTLWARLKRGMYFSAAIEMLDRRSGRKGLILRRAA